MQKISAYYYPNRIPLLADITAFQVEYTNVYQRDVKIYNGIDNIIEFDIKNADQKRIDLANWSNIKMTVMDVMGNELPSSPYTITPVLAQRGIGVVTVPSQDLENLNNQYLRYSVTATINNQQRLLYADTRFGGSGTLELQNTIVPQTRPDRVYDTFTREADINHVVTFHSSAIPVKFYESIPTTTQTFEIHVSGFIGSIWLEATKSGTITLDSFKPEGKPWGSWTRSHTDGQFTGIIPYGNNIDITDYTYIRVCYQTQSITGVGASFTVNKLNGSYGVVLRSGGTGYSIGSQIRIYGSQIGGVNGVNDLFITVTGTNAGGHPSSYEVSSITNIGWTGTSAAGTGTYFVSGTNYAGVVEKVVVY